MNQVIFVEEQFFSLVLKSCGQIGLCTVVTSLIKLVKCAYVWFYSVTSIFNRLTPGKLKEFCRSHADLSYSFSVYYSELRSSLVFSKRSSVIISKAPD